MNFEELEKYIKEQKQATIPEVQRKFSLKYGETRQAFQKLQNEGKIKLREGVTYEWCLPEPQRKTREEIEALRDLFYKDGPLLESWLDQFEIIDDEEDEEDRKREIVTLDSVMNTDEFKNSKGKLNFVVGRDPSGKAVIADLATLPHMLVAGTTGSGKSCVLNSMIASMARRYSPDYVKFLLADTKMVELSRFNGLPHLATPEAITAKDDILAAMDYLIEKMDRRYHVFIASNVVNIEEYNRKSKDKLPYLVFVLDELSDVMLGNKRAFEIKLLRLAQKCRASGIHIVLATQRPDVSTVTGTVKASLPARIALRVSNKYDSNTILGSGGAENLTGCGDMLFISMGSSDVQHVQGALVTSEEIKRVVEQLKAKYPCKFDVEVKNKIFLSRQNAQPTPEPSNSVPDPLCRRALKFWLEKQNGRASIASIQRNLVIGFNRAGRIMDYCQKMGYVEELKENDPSSRPLRVLITVEDVERLFPNQDD